jgi:hypothetical protein
LSKRPNGAGSRPGFSRVSFVCETGDDASPDKRDQRDRCGNAETCSEFGNSIPVILNVEDHVAAEQIKTMKIGGTWRQLRPATISRVVVATTGGGAADGDTPGDPSNQQDSQRTEHFRHTVRRYDHSNFLTLSR